jgi:glycosyltransferase involved in cell wall biosynthesis
LLAHEVDLGGSEAAGHRDEERAHVSMLLDNHYGPDARVAFEVGLLADAGISTRIVAWDRRSPPVAAEGATNEALTRIAVPAPSGGGWRTLVALLRFGRKAWRARQPLFGGSALLWVHDIYLLPLGWALARNLRVPFVYDAHEDFQRAEARRYPKGVLRLAALGEGRLARAAVVVVVPGASRVPRWRGVLPREPIVLPNFVERAQAPPSSQPPEWDLLYAGTISAERRPDLLVELARNRADLRIAVAGSGRGAATVEQAAAGIPNLEFLGWRTDVDELFDRTRSIYYGLDPSHPYSDVACPNTLYQTLRHRRPLIFFCGGEPADLGSRFRIGVRCAPEATALAAAVDVALAQSSWQFDLAWQDVWREADVSAFVETIANAADRER